MEIVTLGNTGIETSKLAFGTLPMGPLQRNAPAEDCIRMIQLALERNITFLDTAQAYGTYGYIRQALQGWQKTVVIASKSHQKSYAGMASAVEEARREMDRDVVDIFLMHAVQNDQDMQERRPALDCLLELKAKGVIRAVGLSTHNLEVVESVARYSEMDIIHPIFNKIHFGLINVGSKDPAAIIQSLFERGIGIYAMKPLAGGNLYQDAPAALRYVLDFPYIHAVAIGMVKPQELDVNMKVYYHETLSQDEVEAAAQNKRVFIGMICQRCGQCLEVCEHSAIAMGEKVAVIDPEKCVLCGYCRKSCEFGAIRVI